MTFVELFVKKINFFVNKGARKIDLFLKKFKGTFSKRDLKVYYY
jgi:hypothetical protein